MQKLTLVNCVAHAAVNSPGAVQLLVCLLTCLDNLFEECHRAIKGITGPMLSFKSFRSARNVIALLNPCTCCARNHCDMWLFFRRPAPNKA